MPRKQFRSIDPTSVEKRLARLIEQHCPRESRGAISVESVKKQIWNERGPAMESSQKFQKWFFNAFPGLDFDSPLFDAVLALAQDTWNVFPHQSLGGKSPQEIMKSKIRKNPPCAKERNQKPDMIVGGVRIPWDEYWEMIKKMEQLQKPFKREVKKVFLPTYKRHLANEKKLAASIVEKHYSVARIFFDRVLQVGFLTYPMIRPDFARREFPRWWQTHVMFDSRDENEVWSSLSKLLLFLEERFGKVMLGKKPKR